MQDLLTFMIISAVVRKLELEKRLNNSAKNNTPKNDELFVNDLEEELYRSKELIATIEKYFELTQNKKCQKSKLNTQTQTGNTQPQT